ncbi:MAG: DUF2069 domain-containing protein [Nevskiales bacterium]
MKFGLLRALALAACAVLALGLVSMLHDSPLWLGLLLVPIILTLPGLFRGQRYIFAVCSLLSLAYIGLGITETIAAPTLGTYAVLNSAGAWFLLSVLYVRRTRAL